MHFKRLSMALIQILEFEYNDVTLVAETSELGLKAFDYVAPVVYDSANLNNAKSNERTVTSERIPATTTPATSSSKSTSSSSPASSSSSSSSSSIPSPFRPVCRHVHDDDVKAAICRLCQLLGFYCGIESLFSFRKTIDCSLRFFPPLSFLNAMT